MRHGIGWGALALALASWPAGWAGAQSPAVSKADSAAIFKAAGAVQRGGRWVLCKEDPQVEGATIETLRDLNGDGRPEAVVTEGGLFCHGAAGMGFVLLSRQPDGRWKRVTGDSGVPEFLKSKGKDGWPDLSIGGPGFCFPVQRWNGSAYVPHRFEYEGKVCRP